MNRSSGAETRSVSRGMSIGAARMWACAAVTASGWGLVPSAFAQCPSLVTRLTSPTPDVDGFGIDVAISGDRIVVGAHLDRGPDSIGGAPHVYRLVGGSWVHEVELHAPSASEGDTGGRRVAISGRRVVSGAISDDPFGDQPNAGTVAVFFFRTSDSMWTQETTLSASDSRAELLFGSDVSIDGDVVLVGAVGDDTAGTRSGAAYVYRRTGFFWNEEAKFVVEGSSPFRGMGDSVSVSGDVAAVGAGGENMGDGAVYIWSYADGKWAFESTLSPLGPLTQAGFGEQIDLKGDHLIASARSLDTGHDYIGAAVIMARSGFDSWSVEQILLPTGAGVGEEFGEQVAISGDLALVTSTWTDDEGVENRYVYVFHRGSDGWEQQARFAPSSSEPGEVFGIAVGLDGTTGVAGGFVKRGSTGGAYVLDAGACSGPACACVADFDGSGGTPDSSDIDAFFSAWLLGDASADADCSGGTPDASDIDGFFTQWLAGGC